MLKAFPDFDLGTFFMKFCDLLLIWSISECVRVIIGVFLALFDFKLAVLCDMVFSFKFYATFCFNYPNS